MDYSTDFSSDDFSENIAAQIKDTLNQMADLPLGYIVKKNINGTEYYYRRVKIGKECTETYISGDTVDSVREQIIKRRGLEKKLRELENMQPLHVGELTSDAKNFMTDIATGRELSELVRHAVSLKKRDAADCVMRYLKSDCRERVFLLCGLMGSGNTTLMLQTIAEMDEESFLKSAYLRIKKSDNFIRLNHDMKLLRRLGFKYVFVDNVTEMDDFITGAGLFSDLFGGYGLKFVITGSDSLGVMLTENGELWHSCLLLKTTYVSYRESRSVIDLNGIDEYVCRGGTMIADIVKCGNRLMPYDKALTEDYVRKAVAENIETTLLNRKFEGDFGLLDDLHRQKQLSNAVCRVVEDLSVEFVARVLEQRYKFGECGDCRLTVSKMLEMLSSDVYGTRVSADVSEDIKEWLILMGFVEEIKTVDLSDSDANCSLMLFTQPWVRYSYAMILAEKLVSDAAPAFGTDTQIMGEVAEWIREEVTRDVVLMETAAARPGKNVSVLKFDGEDFGMAVKSVKPDCCEIYRIIRGDKIRPEDFVLDDDLRRDIEPRLGKISKHLIIYRGNTADKNGVRLVNVEEYLESL